MGYILSTGNCNFTWPAMTCNWWSAECRVWGECYCCWLSWLNIVDVSHLFLFLSIKWRTAVSREMEKQWSMLTQTINMEVVSFILISSVSFTTSCSQNTYVGYEPRHKAWRQGHSLTLGRGECHDQWPMLKKSKEECFTSQAVGAGCCCWPPRPHCLWECRDGVASAPVHLGEVRGQSRLLYTEAGDAPIMTGDAPSQSCPKPPLEVWNIWHMCCVCCTGSRAAWLRHWH